MPAIKKISLFIVVCLVAISCRTSKTTSNYSSNTTATNDSTAHGVDTSKKITTNIVEQSSNYGDTLTGSLQFSDDQINESDSSNPVFYSVVTDSVESSGVKVIVKLTKTKTGIKTNLKAIAKPKSVSTKTINTTIEKKGIDTTKNVSQKTVTTTLQNSKKVVGMQPWLKWLLVIALIISTLIIIYKIYKKYGP